MLLTMRPRRHLLLLAARLCGASGSIRAWAGRHMRGEQIEDLCTVCAAIFCLCSWVLVCNTLCLDLEGPQAPNQPWNKEMSNQTHEPRNEQTSPMHEEIEWGQAQP